MVLAIFMHENGPLGGATYVLTYDNLSNHSYGSCEPECTFILIILKTIFLVSP